MTTLRLLTALILREIARLARSGIDWRAFVLRKQVFEVPRDLQPTPDGSSTGYIRLAIQATERSRAGEGGSDREDASLFLTALDLLAQEQVARSHLLERALIERSR